MNFQFIILQKNLLILIGSIYYYALMSREFYILCKKLKSCSQEQDLNHLNASVCPCSVTLYYGVMIQMMTSDTQFFCVFQEVALVKKAKS